MKLRKINIDIDLQFENCEGRREPAANDRFRPTIDAWLERWKSDDEENQWIFPSMTMRPHMKSDEAPDEESVAVSSVPGEEKYSRIQSWY